MLGGFVLDRVGGKGATHKNKARNRRMASTDDRVAHVAAYLEILIFKAGIPIRELEVRLGVSHGTLARLLSGRVELKFRHVFEILEVLGIPGEAFFRGLATPGSVSLPGMMRRVQNTRLAAPSSSYTATTGVTREEVQEMIRLAVESMLQGNNYGSEPPTEPSEGG